MRGLLQKRGLADHVHRLQFTGARLALRGTAVEGGGLGPAVVDRLVGHDLDGMRLLAGQLDQRAQHAGIGGAALLQRAEDGDCRMCTISARKARASRGGCVEANSSTTGR